MNLLASHPEVCTVGETHQLFKGSSVLDSPLQMISKALLRDMPLFLSSWQDFTSPRNWKPRRPASQRTCDLIHGVLSQSKVTSRHRHLNRFKAPQVEYLLSEIRRSRMVAKNLDGAAFLSDTLHRIYPEAQFVGFVRHGLAVCEGHVRRGRKATMVGKMYHSVVSKMLDDAAAMENYHILKFEDFVADPIRQLRQLYVKLNLNPFIVRDIRFQDRKMVNSSGKHELKKGREWELRWFPIDELPNNIDTRINERQINQLSDEHRVAFLSEASWALDAMGYTPHQNVSRAA